MNNDEYLIPVSQRLGKAILAFCRERESFHADDLRRYVARKCGGCAPGSADRVLRHLRSQGHLDYIVTDRRRSLYQVTSIEEAQA